MLYRNPVDARACRNHLEIATTGEIAFLIHAPGIQIERFAHDCWRLPGLCVRVETNAEAADVQPGAGLFEVRYSVVSDAPITCVLTCEDD
jgi:hypothetical protein